MLSPGAMAGSEKSPGNCAGVGSVVVKCYECRSAQKRYLGKVAVLAGYEESEGEKYCVPAASAKQACASTHGVNANVVGFYATYKIGLSTKKEYYRPDCVNAVGK